MKFDRPALALALAQQAVAAIAAEACARRRRRLAGDAFKRFSLKRLPREELRAWLASCRAGRPRPSRR